MGNVFCRTPTLARLKENRDKLTRAEKDKVELEDELTDIPRLEEQVRHFKETDVPTRLSEVTRLNQDEAVFSEGRSRVADAKSTLTGLTDTQLAAKLGATYDGLDESPHRPKRRSSQQRPQSPRPKLVGRTPSVSSATITQRSCASESRTALNPTSI